MIPVTPVAQGISQEGLTLLNVLLFDGVAFLAIYAGLQQFWIKPERERRKEIYDRLVEVEKENAEMKGWKEAHESSDGEMVAAMNSMAQEVRGFSDRLLTLETKWEGAKNV